MVVYNASLCINSSTRCVELLGPASEIAAASIPVVITVSHGGTLTPPEYSVRDCAGNPSWVCNADSDTIDVSLALAAAFGRLYAGKCPWIVINRLHRSVLDANRDVAEAADGDVGAIAAWQAFHDYVTAAQTKVNTLHGNDGSAIKGWLVDLHGYAGTDFRAGGSPYSLFGYRLSANTLNQSTLPNSPSGSMTLGSQRLGEGGLERLVRGNISLGAQVPAINTSLVIGTMPNGCGEPVPSPTHPSPLVLCPSCHYFSGGYDLRVHENNVVGGLGMNGAQLEAPRCIRNASRFYSAVTRSDVAAIHVDYCNHLAAGLCSMLQGVFGETLC